LTPFSLFKIYDIMCEHCVLASKSVSFLMMRLLRTELKQLFLLLRKCSCKPAGGLHKNSVDPPPLFCIRFQVPVVESACTTARHFLRFQLRRTITPHLTNTERWIRNSCISHGWIHKRHTPSSVTLGDVLRLQSIDARDHAHA
jgi:hypothetical protein